MNDEQAIAEEGKWREESAAQEAWEAWGEANGETIQGTELQDALDGWMIDLAVVDRDDSEGFAPLGDTLVLHLSNGSQLRIQSRGDDGRSSSFEIRHKAAAPK